jgi:Putative phage tail protein
MATLVLTVVGSVIGGPIGGAIGAAIGQQIDNRLFAPKGRQGPRLGELTFQSSTYGAPLPKLFGRTRVAGSIIWATDIKEDRRKVSTGKGRPKQTVYSYSASFAVALSARKISRIGRIWADGKLLRGEAGDFKSQTEFRVHTGDQDQMPDPLIATIEGNAGTPAYRGTAYAVFEDFQLSDYGNRIPSLSFEVIADEAPVSIGAILEDLASGNLTANCPSLLDGIAITGDSIRGVAETFHAVAPLRGWDTTTGLLISEETRPGPSLVTNQLGVAKGETKGPLFERERRHQSSIGGRRTILYSDIDRDYLQGSQSVLRPDLGQQERRIDLAASLSAARAKQFAQRSFASDLISQDQLRLSLGIRFIGLAPGMTVTVAGVSGLWVVADVAVEEMIVKVLLYRKPSAPLSGVRADAGRGLFEPDLSQGITTLHLLDLPWLGFGLANAPALSVAAAGASAGWRQAALLQSIDGGFSFEEIGSTAPSATIGTMTTSLAPSTTVGFDLANSAEVTLLNSAMDLTNTTKDGLVAGQNLALIGDELVQFETATPLGLQRFRLSNLLRGRRGTEHAIANHAVGERFVLISSETLLPLTIPTGTNEVRITASGLGDILPVSATTTGFGAAVQPLPPVHVTANRETNGDIRLAWVRQSRDGWRWIDAVDAPTGEESEQYEVRIDPSPASSRMLTTASNQWLYSAAERAADIAAGANQITVHIRQVGTYGRSRAATLSLSIT